MVIERFNRQFENMYGYPPSRLGIESMNGADFFPDWRARQTLGEFRAEAERVPAEKRKNAEAYRSEGQLKSQAESRRFEAKEDHSRRVRDLERVRSAISEIDAGTEPPQEKERRKAALVEEILNTYRQQKIEARSLNELEEEFKRLSPWTEVGWDRSSNTPRASFLEDPKEKILVAKPEFVKRFAFDGAWDNWLMYELHAHNRRKYMLRSIAEGTSLLCRRDGVRLTTLEYEKVYETGARARLDAFIDEIYSHLDSDERQCDQIRGLSSEMVYLLGEDFK